MASVDEGNVVQTLSPGTAGSDSIELGPVSGVGVGGEVVVTETSCEEVSSEGTPPSAEATSEEPPPAPEASQNDDSSAVKSDLELLSPGETGVEELSLIDANNEEMTSAAEPEPASAAEPETALDNLNSSKTISEDTPSANLILEEAPITDIPGEVGEEEAALQEPPRVDNADSCIAAAALLPVYCPSDVARHSFQDDAWLSLHGRVYDITPLLLPGGVKIVSDSELLIAHAGKDVSHWFSEKGHRVKTFVDPLTNLVSPYLPSGRIPHVSPVGIPTTGWSPPSSPPWWQNPALVVGRLTARARRLRIVNTLTSHEHFMDVGCEQTVAEIATKYLEYNSHSRGYTWKVLKPDYDCAVLPLDMGKTLEENKVTDDGEEIETLGLDTEDDDLLPTVLLYYSDELTVA